MAKRAVKDFPPEYMLCWQAAIQGKLDLRLSTPGKATNLRQQLYIFRKRLNEEAPELAAPFFEVDLKIEDSRIVAHVLDWKRQVRSAILENPNSGEQIGEAIEQAAEQSAAPLLDGKPPDPAGDAMSGTLENLGFKLEKP